MKHSQGSRLAGRAPGGSGGACPQDHWIEIPATLVSHYGVVRLRGSSRMTVVEILQALREGTWRKPFVIDDGVTRRLHFDFESIQSEMTIARPFELNLAYTRKMMAFLLFHQRPEHVVLVGLGGGSLTRFCHRHLPDTRVTTVEIDQDVINMSDLFACPVGDGRSQLVHADAVDYFARTDDPADVVLIDGCDRHGTAATFRDPDFYRQLRARLRPDGMVVVNLTGRHSRKAATLAGIRSVFDERHITINVADGGNQLLFLFNDGCPSPDWQSVRRRAVALADAYRLDFPSFARRLQGNYRLPGW